MSKENLTVVLNERPKAEIIPGTTFHQKTVPLPKPEDLKDDQILVEVLYLGLDPAMRGWLRDTRSYLPPVQIGEIMRGGSVARVLASKNSTAKTGDFVFAMSGWQQYAILGPDKFEPSSDYPGLRDPKDVISYLGLTGMTAWVGMSHYANPQPGELVVVSGAAGATGSVAGQIAKIKGAKVVGTAGTPEKCKWLVDELGFDVALCYKDADYKEKFKEATKDLIDVYFDNVGGETLELALGQAKQGGRFIECGQISQYNKAVSEGPKNFSMIVAMRLTVQGFIIFDHADKFPKARKELSQWAGEGKLKTAETVVKGGLEVAEKTLVGLYSGLNQGKLIVEIKNPEETPSKL